MAPIAGTFRHNKTHTEVGLRWSLNNYRVHELYYGKGVESPRFQLANCGETYMRYRYLDEYAVIDLNVPDELDLPYITFKVFIINESDDKSRIGVGTEVIGHMPCHMSERHLSTKEVNCFVRNRIIPRADVPTKKGCLTDDTLTMLCQITIIDRHRISKGALRRVSASDCSAYDEKSFSATPLEAETTGGNVTSWEHGFGDFFDTPSFSDVTISVKNRKFHVHKIVLAAQSPVFRAMFTNLMSESIENFVEITDADSTIFEAFLRTLYTGSIKKMDKYVCDILILADKYQVERLKNLCEESIVNGLRSNNVIEYLILGHFHGFVNLKKRALSLAMSCGKQISMYPDFHKLCNYPDLLAELVQNMM